MIARNRAVERTVGPLHHCGRHHTSEISHHKQNNNRSAILVLKSFRKRATKSIFIQTKLRASARDMPVTMERAADDSLLLDVRLEATVKDQMWMQQFRALEAFQKANGHCIVSSAYADRSLAVWVIKQRFYRKARTIRKDREQLLQDLGFVWSTQHTRETDDTHRMKRYYELVSMKKKSRHSHVSEDRELNQQVDRSNTLRRDRQEVHAGTTRFVHSVKPSPIMRVPAVPSHTFELISEQELEDSWYSMMDRLKRYYLHHGHINIPTNHVEGQELLQWVSQQRDLRQLGLLEAKQEQALCEIGFSWEPQAIDESANRDSGRSKIEDELWMSQFRSLCEFKKKNGHTNVPRAGETIGLSQWLSVQNLRIKRERLPEDKKKMLADVLTTESLTPIAASLVSSDIHAASKAEYSSEEKPDPASLCTTARLWDEANAATSTKIKEETPEMDEKFAVGSRIKEACNGDEESQVFGGNVKLDPAKRGRYIMSEKDAQLWTSQFRLLCEFKQMHGHTILPLTGDTVALARWLCDQNDLAEKGILPEDMQKMLAGVLFSESARPTADALGSLTSDKHAMFKVENPVKGESCPISINDKRTCLKTEAPAYEKLARHSRYSSEDPTTQASVSGSSNQSVANTEAIDTPLEASWSSKENAHRPLEMGQTFPIGTRIEKFFDVDGVSQTFGGNVAAFEYFKDEYGTRTWGYLIKYDDGDEEHMLEADVAKNRALAENPKRTAKSHTYPSTSKRMKQVHASNKDACTSALNKKKLESTRCLTKTKISKHPESIVRVKCTASASGSDRGHVESRARSKAIKRISGEGNARALRLFDIKPCRRPGLQHTSKQLESAVDSKKAGRNISRNDRVHSEAKKTYR